MRWARSTSLGRVAAIKMMLERVSAGQIWACIIIPKKFLLLFRTGIFFTTSEIPPFSFLLFPFLFLIFNFQCLIITGIASEKDLSRYRRPRVIT